MMTKKKINIAVVQFEDTEGPDIRTVESISAIYDWYLFNEMDIEEYNWTINDLKEHYDLVLEVK